MVTASFPLCLTRGSPHRIRVYPCPSVAKSLVFFDVRPAFEGWFWATDGHGYTRCTHEKKAAPPFGEARLRVVNRVKLSSPCPRGHGPEADRRASSRGCRRSW